MLPGICRARGDFGRGHRDCTNKARPACAHGERALEDLAFFSHQVKILGVYPAHPYRLHGEAGENTYRPG
ncbi:MAG: hypothetical protein O7A64_10195 [Alphaproteobacteria bacterium]|nr:hypothetical protein [Alphaproteobacteria bacterium]